MSIVDLDKALKSAEARLGTVPRTRKRRADAGVTRLPEPAVSELRRLLGGQERPSMRDVGRELGVFCQARGLRPPARATLYRFMAEVPMHHYRVAGLPPWVGASLYNLDADARVPGHQLVFYAFNYGDARAMSFAAALPWVDLYQAARIRGWRAMSLGPLRAAMRKRKIR
jgi:hypothetical protein